MLGYCLRRLATLAPVFLVVSAVIFLIIHLLPGDPIDHLIRIGAGEEQRREIAARYGLDRSLVVQYLIWLTKALTGDLGTAIVARRPVADLIAQVLPNSLLLGLLALAFSAIAGSVLGTIAALNARRWLDHAIMGGVLIGSTLPGFWLGLLLMLVFAVVLGWFPVSGAKDWTSLVLPVVTIGLGGSALIARVTRIAIIEAMQQDFVLLLHAKGLSRARIYLLHVLRHALIPVVTLLGLRIGWILGGAVTVEVVFARPGLGTLLIKGLNQHDYPVVQACLLLLAIAVLIGTLLGDILQAMIDPRIKEALK